MVDLNKEIKLGDLFKRPKRSKGPSTPVHRAKSTKSKSKKQEIIGVKVGASQLAAARVVNNGGVPKLVQLARQPIEPGIIDSGEVRDVAALGRVLNDFFTKNKLPRRGIRLGLGTNRIGVRSIDIEGIDDDRQLANAVRFRAHEALAIPMEDAVLDYHVTREDADANGGVMRRVLLAAAYREPIDHYVEAFRLANLELTGIDVEAFALLRAVAPGAGDTASEEPPAALVAVSLGHDRSTLAISDGTVCDFMRVLEWGGANLESALSRDLGLTLEEAAELKLSIDLDDQTDDPRLGRAQATVRRELQGLAREIVASLQFYQSEQGSLPIREILCTGGTTRMPGLVAELERLIRAKVRAADPLSAVHAESGVSERDDLASLTIAIGLGVER